MANESAWNISATDAYTLFKEVNELTNGWYVSLTLIAIYIIILVVFRNHPTKVTFITAGLVTFVVGLFFWALEILSFNLLLIPISLFLLSILYYIFGGD